MSNKLADQKAQLIERAIDLIKERLSEDILATAEPFVRHYYAWVAPEDLFDNDPEDLYGAALSHWNLGRQRQPGTPAVRVYNPSFEEDGWQCTHTVVEIVTDDMPFLVDSMTMELNRHGLTVHRVIHPVLCVVRDNQGHRQRILNGATEEGISEATMHFEVDRQTDPTSLASLQAGLLKILGDVRAAVEDWPAMRDKLLAVVTALETERIPLHPSEVSENQAFLRWMTNEHFTFLGYRDYDLVEKNGEVLLCTVPGSGLGLLRGGEGGVSRSFSELPAELRRLSYAPRLLIISKASALSTVHRPVHLDYLGIKRFGAEGQVIGEHRFLGLYTAQAYNTNPRRIPLLRSKIEKVLERTHLAPQGHAGKALQNILETFPRDDLFQATDEELFETATGILHLNERQRLRLFMRIDLFQRFVSCLVFVPRERYNTEMRLRMQDILMQTLNGESSSFSTQFTESVLARVQFHIRTHPGKIPEFTVADLESQLRQAMQSWEEELHRALLEQCGEETGNDLFHHYSQAFPVAYKDDFTARTAVSDVLRLETICSRCPLDMRLYRPLEAPEGTLRFKVFGPRQPIPLSDVLPMLEHMGLRVLTARPYELITRDGRPLWVLDFNMKEDAGIQVDAPQVKDIFQEAFARVWEGAMESDGFNRLILAAQLPWRDVVMLRAYCRYLLQTQITFSQAYMERTLGAHPRIVGFLAELFHMRFDPRHQADSGRRSTDLTVAIEEALEKVSSLDEDRILRRFLNIIQATLRTNFFQLDTAGQPKPYLSFKFDPTRIDELPLPRPMYEIFVYSPRVEAVHLRGGPVARGGLRWSDRREDFRTEVLGLMKAQMVKNAVIVPVGAKGGFVLKRPPAKREELQQEGIACYQTFIRGMLDITDNRIGGNIVSPPQVVRYDRDDPYLVVAADKGTATFSDIANGIAREYAFWLDDAFASGGSAGYDHKKMGITARGAWESVKRHFRELGRDIQNRDDFTVVGIGDMSGDVFGNGMLLSRHIKLLAAFNHLHVFIDPDPDPELSFRERQRLFELPRSTWDDYDKSRLSAGGAIYPRSAKSIQLSPEARAALDIKAERLAPNELIRLLLKAPVDLLWNGGIGTYVKAARETQLEVGDRSNDAVRINGCELRCQVVGEGGNLGFTQLGRIEFARRGGRVLTDAIDNSGGVNCSDHEVNIKILLNQVVADGDMTEKQRNQLLAEMTDEVGELVLRQNYLQPQAITMTYSRAAEFLGDHVRVMRSLEKAGQLNRALEFLPSDEELAEREAAREGLTPPEIAVLLAYGKIALHAELLTSDVPEDSYLQNDLLAYFPQPLRERFYDAMQNHPLRREIIATYITNSMLNRMGSSFAFRLWEETGETYPNIARAYSAARETFDARRLWSAIETLDNQVSAALQTQMISHSQRLLERASLWLLRHRRPPLEIEAVVRQFGPGVATLAAALPDLLQAGESDDLQVGREELVRGGVPVELAQWVASLDALYSALDLVEVAAQTELPEVEAAAIYFGLVKHLELNWLRRSILDLPANNHWQNRARGALLNSLYDQGRALTIDVIRTTDQGVPPVQRLQTWLAHNHAGIDRCRTMFADLRTAGQGDLAMLSVALRETASLVRQRAG
ncbi:MAG: NAD-glutamate dehydrogenase [Gammaproteobacteria bacterium]|nr:NAD-glutamate dehydrogenase [Gammaproteobacteria bacterium]MCP5424386.1 NAD-glutamate dehydrogenase [Gammaproteobacteria bacterium]